ncbi:hypothetical protein niasHT_030742 [Heterodera trifolii]|uniref:Uncharacterized protein n=1 Tax=Heterodera trifolii TaxID=157864 RepID=A0ABD2HQ42_9BILA
MFFNAKPKTVPRLRVPFRSFSICFLLVLLLLLREIAGPRLKMPPRMRTLPLPVPSPSSYSIQFVVYATITNVGTEHSTEKKSVWRNAVAHNSNWHHRSHRHSHHVKKRRRQNAGGRNDDEQTARKVAELMEELKRTEEEKQERKVDRTRTNGTTADEIGTEVITWQLFSQCSKAFVRVRADNGKVDARGGTGEADAECQTLFSPELVAGEGAPRGMFRLLHLRSGRLLCLGRRQGIVARKRTSYSLRDPLCWLREDLTPSGYASLSAARPIGFSRGGRPVTHPSRLWGDASAGRCFQFAKLISRRRVQHHWQRRCPPPSIVPTPNGRRARAGDDQALREMARRALLAKIEAREEEDGSGTAADEPFALSIAI